MKHEVIMEIEDEDFHKYGLEGCREIIRCKDCKWWNDYRECESPNWTPDYDGCLVQPAGMFCGWGERRTDETD